MVTTTMGTCLVVCTRHRTKSFFENRQVLAIFVTSVFFAEIRHCWASSIIDKNCRAALEALSGQTLLPSSTKAVQCGTPLIPRKRLLRKPG